ncbi:hypothetical protein AX14_005788 [Amanita brunnescens Koide BX004]|nr:hypothetical protein AX14_005788 [Amanita brunnescens Koide BX004]
MVKFNFPSLFLILTTAATLVFASAPPLQSIKCVTTGLFISNVGGFGLNVTSNGNADNGLSFWESGSSLAIGGESGWFIAPALPMLPDGTTYLVWQLTPFQWTLETAKPGSGPFLITGIVDGAKLHWIGVADGINVALGEATNDNLFTINLI